MFTRKLVMISGVSSLSTNAISLLFDTGSATETLTESTASTAVGEATGNTDDVFKAGNAIGKIIEIVAGMNQSDALFTMEGALRTENADGSYMLTKTGTGLAVSEAELFESGLKAFRKAAAGTGPEAEQARAYLKAVEEGTIERYDMAQFGVTSIMTQTNFYNADGSDRGVSGSWDTKGMEEFLEQYVEIRDGMKFDKATGKYAAISQNGTKFTYSVW
jgi:hypothetical protein